MGDDPDDVRGHENVDNPGPGRGIIVCPQLSGNGAANIRTLMALLRVTGEDNWVRRQFLMPSQIAIVRVFRRVMSILVSWLEITE